MRNRYIRLTATAALLTPAFALAAAGPAVAAPAALAPPGVFSCPWNGAQPPGPGAGQAELRFLGVTATSPCDVWAVGSAESTSQTVSVGPAQAVIEHWTGGAWTSVPTPPLSDSSVLYGVAATSASDVWAVGAQRDTGAVQRGALLHWDGSSWTEMDPPATATTGSLTAVSADSATDAWAVGATNDALVLHWDGTAWTAVDNPATGEPAILTSISAASPGNVWAAGFEADTPAGPVATDGTVMHWDGSSWTQFTLNASVITGIVALPGGGAYAVGRTGSPSASSTVTPAVFRWDGTSWSQVSLPSPGISGPGSDVDLAAVTATSGSDVWAAGQGTISGGSASALMLHWDGTAWKWITPPSAAGHAAIAVTATGPGSAWTVGSNDADTLPYASPAPVVPTVQGLPLATAQGALAAAGLRGDNVSRTGQCAAASSGNVTGSSPGTGAQAAYNTEIALTECVWLTVPNVQGFDDASAQHAITSTGLTVGTVSQTNNQCLGPAGEVITQSPAGQTLAANGTPVNLTESSGRNSSGKPCGSGGTSPK